MLLTTPESIRTLQTTAWMQEVEQRREQLPRKLYVKAKQQPAYRFHALYDKLYRADILSHDWQLVRANCGSPGIDGKKPVCYSTHLRPPVAECNALNLRIRITALL